MVRILLGVFAILSLGCSSKPESSLPPDSAKEMSDAESLYRQGTALLDSDPEAAIELLTQSLEAGPDAPPALYNRAVAYASVGRDADAVADVTRLEEVEPELGAQLRMQFALTAAPYVDIAQSEFESGNYEMALAKYESAIVYNPTYVDAWIGKAAVLEKLNRPDEAAAARVKAEELDQSTNQD
ncbi:MAG: tetratricopeptide repeat protein [Pirellulaceae bacterium]